MRNLARLIAYLRFHRLGVAAGFGALAGSVLFTSLTPWVLKQAIDNGIGAHKRRALLISAAAIMLFSLGRGFFSYLLSYFGESLSQHVAFDLRRDFYDRVQALYTNRFFDPIRDATQQYINLQRATVAAERIFEILDTPQTVQEKPDATVLGDVRGDIEFRDVRFEYVPGIEVLHAVNLRVRPGEHVAIVGQTGAEKSTLVSLLARFYDVSGGAVLVDGHDIQDVTLQSLRRSMGSYSRIRSFFLGRCGTTSFTGVRPPLPRR